MNAPQAFPPANCGWIFSILKQPGLRVCAGSVAPRSITFVYAMWRPFALPAFLGWIVLPTLGDATTIVVLQTPDQVLVAADARAVSLLADSGVPATATRQVCKIVRTPHTVIALAGILGNLSEFDTRGFVQKTCLSIPRLKMLPTGSRRSQSPR